MRKNLITGLATMALASLTWSAYSQSPYFQAMTNLNPVVYLPLQETNQPPLGDVETNYGWLGPVADAVYGSTAHRLVKQSSGATSDGDTAVAFGNASGTDNGAFLGVPTIDVRTAVTNSAFTVECWVNSAQQDDGFEGILSKSGENAGGINNANNQAGWCLSQNYIDYLDSSSMRGWDFHVNNGVGHEGAEILVPYNVTNGVWYHIVATFDGQNCGFYINGVDALASGTAFQISSIGTSYKPDTWNPLEIGASRGINGNKYEGSIDEVAIYTNVLSPARIAAHYAAATGGGYGAAVTNDLPIMYYRMDATAYVAPDPSTYPIATNYGTLPASFFGLYGTAVQPAITGPQLPGMLDPNNGNASYGVGINGLGGNNGNIANVPVGYDQTNGTAEFAPDAAPIIITNSFTDPNTLLLNPTNIADGTVRTPCSVTIWFQGRPHLWNRFETIFGHTDDSWRLAMNQSGRIQWNPGGGGEVATALSYNDQKWHQFVGTYDGSNVLTYVDGLLAASATAVGTNFGSSTFPMLGGDPQYLNAGNATYNIDDMNRAAAAGYGPRVFSGNLAHFAYFTNALTASQVLNLYTNATGGVVSPPVITGQPVTGRVNPAPGFLFFGVVAIGSIGDGALSYQWYFNTSSNYSGATQLVNDGVKYALVNTAQMTVSNLAASDSGYYFVVITNNAGSVTSILASLSVNYGPVITSQSPSANFSLFANQQATLSVTAIADTNLTYQWFVNGAADPAGTNATYVSPGVTTAGTSFYCIVSNTVGTATSTVVAAASILPLPAALTNSPFGSNILALNPTAYWPMHESGETPAPASVETNYGSLGVVANGTYGDWRYNMAAAVGVSPVGNENAPTNMAVVHGLRGAIAGDSDTCVNLIGAAQNDGFVVVPRTDSAHSTIRAPFTLEAWVRPLDPTGFGVILGEDSSDVNATGVFGGFDWLYSGTRNAFSVTVRNGSGSGSTEPKTSANYPPGQWYHVVTLFNGTNVDYYINGVEDTPLNPAATMNPNSWDPITIGCGRGLNGNRFRGSIDEVAVYTNLLPVSEIQKHFNDGTNSTYHNYKADVLADNPLLYYRMDAPVWVPPALSTWPVLTNYGGVAVNGVYTPGSVPGGGVGPSEQGHNVAGLQANNALIADGHSTFADALSVSQFHPTGKTPWTVAAWMKGNPADTGARNWQSVVAEGDSAWRLNMDGNNGRANFNANNTGDTGNSTTSGIHATINDGQWHYVMGTFDGSNTVVYVDGLVSATNFSATVNNASPNVDLFLGGYPDNTVYNNTWASVYNEGSGGGALASDSGRILAGSICEAAFWNGTALTPSQISAIYNSAQVPAFIEKQPISGFANENGGFTNSVVASGSGTLSYQWYKNGQPMPVGGQTNFVPGFGPTSPNLTIYPITTNDQSLNYYVVVTNNYGAVTSAVWSINPVFTVPVFTNDITTTNYLLYAGGHANFSVLAVGAQPIGYSWYSNNVAIPGATGKTYNLVNVQPPNQTNIYYCVASNFIGVTTSSIAVVDIIPVPAVIPYSLVVMTDNPTGFWPMDETNGALMAVDYAGGNDGVYTNASQGQPGFNSSDTNRTSVQFGSTTFQDSDIYAIPTNVDFSITNGGNSNFSIECWVKGFQQTLDAGIVTKGYGGGGEQFNLDCGSDGGTPNHSFRFFFRDASGATHAINSTNNPSDQLWHHLVAVCNETNGQAILYVDGLPVGTSTFSSGLGVLPSTRSMTIGARPSNSTTNDNDLQFTGYIQDVSVYNYALSAQQVLNHYFAADIPATIVHDVVDETACQNGVAMFSTTVLATPPVGYQWYDVNTSLLIPGATNSTLFINNVQTGDSYYLVATNNYGTNQTRTAALSVITGPPQFIVQPPASTFVPKGAPITIPVTVMGTLPMTNQWQMSDTNALSWTNLTDNVRVSGSQQIWLNMTNTQVSKLTINPAKVTDAGDYELITANSAGSSGASSIANIIVGTLPITFNGNGVGWDASQAGTYNNPAVVDGQWEGTEAANGSEARSFFFTYPQYIGAFKVSFIYQVPSGGPPTVNEADGITFCLQNDTRGAAALGGGGGSLGYSGITPSLSLQFNIYPSYNNAASPNSGYGFSTNGLIPFSGTAPYPTPGTINLGGGDPINVSLTYLNGTMSLMMTDRVAQTSFATNILFNIPAAVNGNTAYVGFTAADGGSQATQVITNFTFVSLASEALTVSNGTNAAISWNGLITGYTLEQNGNLAAPNNWVPVPYADIVTNGLHKVTVPINTSTNLFYRLNSAD